ncbi:hypothetical protein [Paenibacillus sedimenti]|uniref:FTP domain-containing protein n=1 Tax=Paenibacillus sedimenti TaxID=2770274 RepID=A0A926KQP1_9BACL|nr:hypothetical protein [Paenibacillus sedimenti]MBD0382294.1 hypothetical protein [Paenibacillus sedimenti]
MYINNLRLILVFCMIFITTTSLFVSAKEIPEEAQKVLHNFIQEGGQTLEIEWNEITDTPSNLHGRLTQPSSHTSTWIAYELLNRFKTLYGISNPYRDLKVAAVTTSDDLHIVRLQHLLFNTPVWGDQLVIEIDKAGIVHRISGTIYPRLDKQLFYRPMVAAISEKKAVQIAVDALRDKVTLFTTAETSLYYLPTRKGNPLVYAVTFRFRNQPAKTLTTMVHALTGKIIPY